MNLHNKILKAINKGLNEALSRFDLDDFNDNELDDNIKLDKSKSTKSAMNKSRQNEWIYKNFVDLDLPSRTLWAKCNLGASKQEAYGDYYAWGETSPKSVYTWKSYKFGNYDELSKYNEIDRKTVLDLEDDAAYQIDHRMCMPNRELFKELIEYTDNEWTEYNGVKGRIFRSKLNPDKFIFIPAAGYSYSDSFSSRNSYCGCWASLRPSIELNYAYCMCFDSIRFSAYDHSRYGGFSIRPVLRK